MGRGTVTWRKPSAYRTWRPPRCGVAWFPVKGWRIGFGAAAWDHRFPLVIDPTLNFSTFLGGSGQEYSRAIAVDDLRQHLHRRHHQFGRFAGHLRSHQSAYKGGSGYGAPSDAFVAKLNPSASALIYITYLGGATGIDWALGVAADSAGSAYVTGFTDSSDFPTTPGAYQTRFGGDSGDGNSPTGDGFVTKFDATGKLVWSTYLGGSKDDLGGGIALNWAGEYGVPTVSSNFPVSNGAYQTKYGGGDGPFTISSQGYVTINSGDGFVAKLDPTGRNCLVPRFWAAAETTWWSPWRWIIKATFGWGGATASSNFPVTANALQSKFGGKSSDTLQAIVQLGDGFVAELSPDLTKLTYSTYLGGSNDDAVTGIAVDSSGGVFVCGFSQSANFPVKGASAGAFHGRHAGRRPPVPAGRRLCRQIDRG